MTITLKDFVWVNGKRISIKDFERMDDLTIDGYLDLSCTTITRLPKNLTVLKGLDLRNTDISDLQKCLLVNNFIHLEGTKITPIATTSHLGWDYYAVVLRNGLRVVGEFYNINPDQADDLFAPGSERWLICKLARGFDVSPANTPSSSAVESDDFAPAI